MDDQFGLPSMPKRETIGNDWKDHWLKNVGVSKECFQSLFCHWCQTCYFLEWQLLIWSKYYHLVDWWGGVNQ